MGPGVVRTWAAGVRKRAGPRIGAWKRVVAAAGRKARGPGMAQTAAAVSGLGRKRVARVLVRCFCRASLDCGEGGGITGKHLAAGEPPAQLSGPGGQPCAFPAHVRSQLSSEPVSTVNTAPAPTRRMLHPTDPVPQLGRSRVMAGGDGPGFWGGLDLSLQQRFPLVPSLPSRTSLPQKLKLG